MAAPNRVPGDLQLGGHLTVGSMDLPANTVSDASVKTNAAIQRDKLAQDPLRPFAVPLTAFRVWDALDSPLPGSSSGDDLGLVGGAFGSASPMLKTSDLKSAGATTLYARALVRAPAEFDAGETMQLRVHAGMQTTVADVAATLDVEAHKSDGEGGVGSDLVTTDAQDINSLTLADKGFTVDASSLAPGDILDVRITITLNDAATATEVAAVIGAVTLLCDIRG